jgi:hypothetical protein
MDGFVVGRPWMPPGGHPGVLIALAERLLVNHNCTTLEKASAKPSSFSK